MCQGSDVSIRPFLRYPRARQLAEPVICSWFDDQIEQLGVHSVAVELGSVVT